MPASRPRFSPPHPAPLSSCSGRHRPSGTGGYPFAEDPSLPGSQARLFWRADLDASVISAIAHRPTGSPGGSFDVGRLRWPAALLQTPCTEELSIDGPGGRIRLSIIKGTLLDGPVELHYRLAPPRLAARLAALARWDVLDRTGRIPRQLKPRTLRQARWPLVIATLDALAEGCSLREVAARLFGPERARRDWNHESDYLKLRTRRLVAQARALVAGGYRALL